MDAPGGTADPLPDGTQPPTVVEQYGDLHEYGLSLGCDLDAEGEDDLQWAVQEAFNAPLSSSWTEYMDDTGRAYYVKEGSNQSTWEHPMDEVYRELLALVKDVRQRMPQPSESQRVDIVREHLKQVHVRAMSQLADWNGPYACEQGEYYYNETLKVSAWDSPVTEWESELTARHAVLSRYLLPEQAARTVASPNSNGNLLQALRLQLGNLQREGVAFGDAPEPSTSRSFHTARSVTSSRSGRSKHHKERKERKERKSREHKTPESLQEDPGAAS